MAHLSTLLSLSLVSTASSKMSSSALNSFYQAIEKRRTYYNLTNKSTLSDAELKTLVETSIKYTPSSYNSQSSRAVLVIGEKNQQLWDAIWAAHVQITPPELKETFEGKFKNAYKAGYGTVVFFEDQAAIDQLVKNQPPVAPLAETWSETTTGMAQYIVWTALAQAGLGANLQHYSQFTPDNAKAVTDFLGVPATWKPKAQMPFGVPADANAPGVAEWPKTFQPLEERVLVVQ